MNQSTKVFLYNQRHRVVWLNTTGNYFTRRYRQMYAKNLRISRGTDNQILFEFVNQDQKPVDITGMTLTFRMIGSEEILLLEKDLVIVNATRGQAKLHVEESELDQIQPQEAYYSVERVDDGSPYEPMYVDDDASARGVIVIQDQVMPAFIESGELTIPTGQPESEYVSSVHSTEHNSLYSYVVQFDGFSGNFEIQGAVDANEITSPTGQKYTIYSQTLENADGLVLYNVTGFHPYIRFEFSNVTAGSVTKIQYR